MSVKKFGFILASLVLTVLLIFFPGIAMPAAADSINIWLSSIVPSVFPFIVCVNMLTSLDSSTFASNKCNSFTRSLLNLPSASMLPVAVGLLSGCPLGGKITASLYQKGVITSDEAQRITGFINNPSPVFVICAIGIGMLNSVSYGQLIYVSVILSAFLCALIFKFYYTKTDKTAAPNSSAARTGDIMSNSVAAILKIGGYIIIFGVLGAFLDYIPYIGKVLSCMAEMTAGSSRIASLDIGMRTKTSLIAFLLSFGGICIQMQVLSFLRGIPIKKYIFIISCVIKGIFSYCFCYTLFPLFNTEVKEAAHIGLNSISADTTSLILLAAALPLAITLGFIIKLKSGTK